MTHSIAPIPYSGLKVRVVNVLLLCVLVLAASFVYSQRAAAEPLPTPHIVAAATDADRCGNGNSFFGLEPWYHFMPNAELGTPSRGSVAQDPCGIRCFNIFVQGNPNDCGQTASDVPGVILAVVDDLLRISSLVAIAFVIVGAFQYVGSRGNAERTAQAQSTIVSALTGLAISLVAVGLVSFIGSQLVS